MVRTEINRMGAGLQQQRHTWAVSWRQVNQHIYKILQARLADGDAKNVVVIVMDSSQTSEFFLRILVPF